MNKIVLRDHRPVLVDFLVLLAIPAILTVIHVSLPDATYNQLVFTYGNPNWITVWTAAVLHASNTHLASNVLGYLAAIGAVYDLYQREIQDRRRFWITIAVLLVIIPPITKLVDYVVLYQAAGVLAAEATSKGFSGVASAFGGMLLATIGLFAADEYNTVIGVNVISLILLGAAAVFAAGNGFFTPRIAGAIVVGLALESILLVSTTDLRQPGSLRDHVTEHRENIVQIAAYGGIVCIFLYGIVPIDFVQSGYVTNVLAHAVGFLIGVATPLPITYIFSQDTGNEDIV
jgi:membrane associated rhomboid family serine protease